jgi:hypothetical protein
MTGLFSHQSAAANNIGRRARNSAKGRRTLEQFAEQLSEHGDVARAADAIGRHEAYGRNLLARLKRELGWQAR